MKLNKLLREVLAQYSGPTGARVRRYIIRYEFDQTWDDEITLFSFRMLKVSEDPLEVLKQYILRNFNQLPQVHLLDPDGYIVIESPGDYYWVTPSDIPQKDFFRAYTLYQKDSKDPECASILGEWLDENFGHNLLTYNRPDFWDTEGMFKSDETD